MKMPEKELTKICGICGDKAIGYYNFNAITCDSCKAFFRRNATKLDQFRCYFEGNCKIDVMTRKLCKKCRLNKCFAIGMKKEWILSEEERMWRNYKIQVNRKKRKTKKKTDGESSSESLVNESESSNEAMKTNEIDSSHLNSANQQFEGQLVAWSDRSSHSDSVVFCGRPLTDYKNNLTEVEGFKLSELLSSMSLLERPLNYRNLIKEPIIEITCNAWANKCQEEAQNIIRMSKCLRGFVALCDNDQLALIKYSCVEVFIIRLIMQYNSDRRYFTIINNDICLHMSMELLRETRKFLFDAYELLVDKAYPHWDFDKNIIYMLTPIILFNPNHPNLCDREEIKKQQNIYKYLLHRYLILRYRSESEANQRFVRLMNMLSIIREVMLTHKWGYQRKDPHQVVPLMKELFDLKFAEDRISYMFKS